MANAVLDDSLGLLRMEKLMENIERILIFGDTPLAARLAFYLDQYGQSKEEPVMVLHHHAKITSIKDVQEAVWQTYVGDKYTGRPDFIVNAYELSDLVLCETDPTQAWHANSQVASMIALAARAADIPLIQISSDHVFHGDHGPYGTDALPRPINVYGVTKWYGEIATMTLYPEATIVRHSALYGYDVDSPPAKVKEKVHLRLADTSAMVPTFIAEFAFLLARNILLAPSSFEEPVIHVSTKEGPITWLDFLSAADIAIDSIAIGDPLIRVGQHRGLVATPGWFLPSRPEGVQWTNFEVEQQTKRSMQFWVDSDSSKSS